MPKNKSPKKKKVNLSPPKRNLQELHDSRTGGSIALRGFTYQLLYTCYLILSELNSHASFVLEGIEDIDKVEHGRKHGETTHIQIKHSSNKQDATFFKDPMKNFLEAYLIDDERSFKLVYDFPVALGHMSKLFNKSLDQNSTIYWQGIVDKIKAENPNWSWSGFIFDDFINKLSFEMKDRTSMEDDIEKCLIEAYDITTDNIRLFANGFQVCCLEKMTSRERLLKSELDALIQDIKDDIEKGVRNPAHDWIKRIVFDNSIVSSDLSYFEGKRPTPQDIVSKLPVRRIKVEAGIKTSVQENRVTVIKASSGQGKSTAALQVAHDLKNEYAIYQLIWCNDPSSLNNIVQYFNSRVRLGEKPLIVVDNLDSQLSEWNRLVQLLQNTAVCQYKILITTREDDWYNYSGDLSNIKSLRIVKLALDQEEAKQIYDTLKTAQKLHPSITDWQKPWLKVADRELLIEYVYLLTHGEMLSERIASQIVNINKEDSGKVICEILRKICFADICGIRLSAKKLIGSLTEISRIDNGEALRSIENEFLIRVDTTEKYIEGLHPVRSQHIIDRLHEFLDLDQTALQVVRIADKSYLSKLFSSFPVLALSNRRTFYPEVVKAMWNGDDLSGYVSALQGTFSGSVMNYYNLNRLAFDVANERGALFIFSTELSPFTMYPEFGYALDTLDSIEKATPDNPNIKYLRKLRDDTQKIILPDTDVYHLSSALFETLGKHELHNTINDTASYSSIMYWLMSVDNCFNLATKMSLAHVWNNRASYTLDTLSAIFFTCFCGDKKNYIRFVKMNIADILEYLRTSTHSLTLEASADEKAIHVNYILLPSDVDKGNEESVSRLKSICMTLPIFETYCADALTPKMDFLSAYDIPDNAHKAMPIRNLIILFHQEFNSLWNKTILSNYEFDSIIEWLEYWFSVRSDVVALIQRSIDCMVKLLEGKSIANMSTGLAALDRKVNNKLICEAKYPNEERPFEDKATAFEGFNKIKMDYFDSISRFHNNLLRFLSRDERETITAIFDIRCTSFSVARMQSFFEKISAVQGALMERHIQLCESEISSVQNLLMTCIYYKENQPSIHFRRYDIQRWYAKKQKLIMENAKNTMSNISKKFMVEFPKKYYYDDKGILSYYPVIVSNFDVEDPGQLVEFCSSCIPFHELNFDYLIVILINEQRKIVPQCLSISKHFFEQLKAALDTAGDDAGSSISPPYPTALTTQMLECFDEQHEILTQVSDYSEIERIIELLWAFSKSRKETNSAIVCQGLTKNNVVSEIQKLLTTVKIQMSQYDHEELSQTCNDVFNGACFDDVDFNSTLSRIIAIHKDSMQ